MPMYPNNMKSMRDGLRGAFVFSNAEAAALVARMTTQPTDARKALVDACIGSIKAAGAWPLIEVLYVPAAHSSQAARLNWVSTSFTSAAINSPAFVTDRGYTSDGSSGYLSSGFDSSVSTTFLQDSAHQGVWIGTEATSSAQNDIGNGRARINSRNSTAANMNINRGGADGFTLPVATSIGHISWVRTSSTACEAFKNGSSMGAGLTTASGVRLADTFFLLASNGGSGVPSNFSTRQLRAAHWGAALTSAQNLAVYNALNTYLTAIGAA